MIKQKRKDCNIHFHIFAGYIKKSTNKEMKTLFLLV